MLRMEGAECNTRLSLGIGGGNSISSRGHTLERKPPVQLHVLFPPRMKKEEKEGQKREKEQIVYRSRSNKAKEEVVQTKEASCCSDDSGRTRKKLRLSKEQSAMLEDSFSEQNTLHPIRKLQLANMLNLRPRQVEVWFQNRRARSKFKKMETNWEVLKKRCENLTDENQRLKRQLQELMLMKSWPPSGVQLSKVSAVFSLCPSCKQIDAGDGGMANDTIDMIPNKPSSIYNMASRILSS